MNEGHRLSMFSSFSSRTQEVESTNVQFLIPVIVKNLKGELEGGGKM